MTQTFSNQQDPNNANNHQKVQEVDQDSSNNYQALRKLCGSQSTYIVLNFLVAFCALACLILTIILLDSAVTYFSSIFKNTDEITAQSYLKENHRSMLATVYISIIGMIIVIVNTAVSFTKFTQKQGLMCIHVLFYLVFIIVGSLGLAQASRRNVVLSDIYSSISAEDCAQADYQCLTYTNFKQFHLTLLVVFIGYCIFFLLFAVILHVSAYKQRIQREKASGITYENDENNRQTLEVESFNSKADRQNIFYGKKMKRKQKNKRKTVQI